MKYTVKNSGQFKKDLKLMQKQGIVLCFQCNAKT